MFSPTRKTLKEWVWNQRSCGRTSDSWNNEVGMLQAFSTAHIFISFAWVDICSLFEVETPMIRRRIQIAYMRRGNYLKVSKRTSATQKKHQRMRKKWKMMKNTTSVQICSAFQLPKKRCKANYSELCERERLNEPSLLGIFVASTDLHLPAVFETVMKQRQRKPKKKQYANISGLSGHSCCDDLAAFVFKGVLLKQRVSHQTVCCCEVTRWK